MGKTAFFHLFLRFLERIQIEYQTNTSVFDCGDLLVCFVVIHQPQVQVPTPFDSF